MIRIDPIPHTLRRLALASASGATALAALTLCAMAPAAYAADTVNGGGSTLIAPVWMQMAKCYDSDTSTFTTSNGVIAGGNSAFLLKGMPVTSQNAAAIAGCTPTTGAIIQYDATGSGAGQAGVLAHDAVISNSTAGLQFGSPDNINTYPPKKVFPSIQYGLSDNSLVQSDLVTYDKGTSSGEHLAFNDDNGLFYSPATYEGLTFTGTTHPNATTYPVPRPLYGALVQFPYAVAPIALAYNPTYGSGKTFNVQAASKDANGGLALDASAYCKIFTGAITNWNDAALTALNGGVSLTGGASVPIKLVGRSDSSGTTSILTRHLAAVCGAYVSSNPYLSGTTTLPASVRSFISTDNGSPYDPNSSDRILAYRVNTTTGALGYLGSDYVLPAVTNTQAVSFSLSQAALKNSSGQFEEANATTASAAFAPLSPPQSKPTGGYVASDTTTDRRDPTQWVQSTAKTAYLANPVASVTNAYPIVGTVNFIGYTCYASAGSVTALENVLNFGATTAGQTVLKNAGLGVLPNKWFTAIGRTFLIPNGDASGLHLFLATAGAGSANPTCAGVPGA